MSKNTETLTDDKATVPFLKKRGKNARKRQRVSPSDSSEEENSKLTAVKKERKLNSSNPFVQETKKEKRENEEVSVTFVSNKSAAPLIPQDVATRYAEWDTETDRDAQALLEKKLAAEEADDDNLYRGQHAYKTYIKKRDTAAGSAASSKIKAGPIRAPMNIRVTSRFDYQPDICKDYKETGYCGYGDSCKFLHDRGDYKTGWQLEREWEEKGKLGKDPNAFLVEGEDSGSEDELPFACLICRQEFKSPIVTKCKHYFCEKCALQNYKQSPKCFVCGAATNGIFNSAKSFAQKLEEKKKRMKERGEKIPIPHDSSDDSDNESSKAQEANVDDESDD